MIIHNSIQCNYCKEVIVSYHKHDFRYCKCSKVAVDGGNDYLRRIGNLNDYQDLSINSDAPFEVIREYLHRYNRYSGSYVKLKDISDNWLQNIIDYFISYKDRFFHSLGNSRVFQMYLTEKLYRAENEIFVPEDSNYELDYGG